MSPNPVFLRYGTLLTHSVLARLLFSTAAVVLLAALTYWALV